MTRSGVLVGVGVLTLATAVLGSAEARTESCVALGKIAVHDTTRAVVIVSAADGRVLSRIRSDSIAGTGDISQDGRWLAVETYPHPKGLVVQSLAGGRARTVAECSAKWCPGWPTWDATGSELAYQQGPFIYTVFANGLGRTRVIRGETPDWSPGTPEIAFVRDFSYYTGAGKVYVAAVDGRDVRYVTRGAYPTSTHRASVFYSVGARTSSRCRLPAARRCASSGTALLPCGPRWSLHRLYALYELSQASGPWRVLWSHLHLSRKRHWKSAADRP